MRNIEKYKLKDGLNEIVHRNSTFFFVQIEVKACCDSEGQQVAKVGQLLATCPNWQTLCHL